MTDFLERMNLALLETEQQLQAEVSRDVDTKDLPPFYFVIGAPRSGTTLLTQLLAYCYDFGYITNVAARFWMNPITGIRASREILGDTVPTFESSYANTSLPGDIHEFGRFWMSHLGISSSQDVDWMVPDAEHAGLTLRALRAIQSEFGKPVVMKGIYPAYAYEWLDEQLGDQVKWVYIEREAIQTCLSILNARDYRLGDINKWFGWHLAKSDRGMLDVNNDLHQQIVTQACYFRRHYRKFADHILHLGNICGSFPFGGWMPPIDGRELIRDIPTLRYRERCEGEDGAIFRECWKKICAD